MLSLYSTTALNRLDYLVSQTTSKGGAGYIYKEELTYNVLAFGYLDEEKAVNIKNQLKEEMSMAKVITLEAPTLKNKASRTLNQNPNLKVVYKELISLTSTLYELPIKYEQDQNIAYVYRTLEKCCYELERVIYTSENYQEEKEITIVLNLSAKIYLSLINGCLDEIYKMSSVLKNLRNLFISCCFEEIHMRNCLNEL